MLTFRSSTCFVVNSFLATTPLIVSSSALQAADQSSRCCTIQAPLCLLLNVVVFLSCSMAMTYVERLECLVSISLCVQYSGALCLVPRPASLSSTSPLISPRNRLCLCLARYWLVLVRVGCFRSSSGRAVIKSLDLHDHLAGN